MTCRSIKFPRILPNASRDLGLGLLRQPKGGPLVLQPELEAERHLDPSGASTHDGYAQRTDGWQYRRYSGIAGR